MAQIYFSRHCHRAIIFTLAPPRRAPPFSVRASGTVALKVAQVPSTGKQYGMGRIRISSLPDPEYWVSSKWPGLYRPKMYCTLMQVMTWICWRSAGWGPAAVAAVAPAAAVAPGWVSWPPPGSHLTLKLHIRRLNMIQFAQGKNFQIKCLNCNNCKFIQFFKVNLHKPQCSLLLSNLLRFFD